MPTFYKPIDNFVTKVNANYTAGSGTMTVLSSAGLGSPSSGAPVRITVIRASDSARCHYSVTGVSGNVLTVAAIDGYTDINFVVNDAVGATISAATFNDIHNTITSNPYVSLKYDMKIPDDATITGVGSPNFNDAGYGTLTLPAAAYTPIGPRGSETVTQRIQALLDTAASGPLGIYWDVRCSVGAQVDASANPISALYFRNPGNLHIISKSGCGVILRAQSNTSIFQNESPQFGTAIANAGTNTQINAIGGINFSNLVIEGLYMNANSGQVASNVAPNQLLPTFGETYYLNVIRLWGVQDVKFKNCKIVGAGGFHTYFGNWQRVSFTDCTIDSLRDNGYGGNDAFHLNGPGDDFTARDCHISTNDDYFGINTADGQNAGQAGGPTVPVWGSLTRVRAYNTYCLRNSVNGNFARIMAVGGCINTGHEFDGIYGTVNRFVLLENSFNNAGGPLGTVEFRNVEVDFVATGIDMNSSTIRKLGLKGIRRSGSHLSVPLLVVEAPINHLDLVDINVYDDGTSGTNKPQIQINSGVTVSKITGTIINLDGNSAGQNMPLINNSGGTITKAVLSGVDSSNITGLISNSGTLTNLVLSNTDPGTVDVVGTAPVAKQGDYYGNASSGPVVYFEDDFSGVLNSALAGHAGTIKNNGTDVWGDIGGLGVMKIGATGAEGSTTATAFSQYPLTSVPADAIYYITTRTVSGAGQAQFQFHRNPSGADDYAVTLNYGAQTVILESTSGGVSATPITIDPVTLSTNVDYVLKATFSGTSLNLQLNGSTIGTTYTTATPGGTYLLIAQNLGSTGDIKFKHVKVTALS